MFGGLVLPSGPGSKVRGGSLGTRSSCAASFGGILSTNAGEKAHGKRHGSLERLPKESYAQALREQMVGHPRAASVEAPQGPALEQDPFVGEAASARRAAAAQGGGRAAALGKDSYASALRDQIVLRDAHRAADGARGRLASPMHAQLDGHAEVEGAGPPRGKRCLPPPMPSRESYAAALEEQIAAREAARHGVVSPPLGAPGPAAVMLAGPEKLRGRRMVGPLDCRDKDSYAAELREQMVARSMRSAADRASSQEPSRSGLAVGGSDWNARGKRQAPQIPGTSKEALGRALQEQMADRDRQKAAGAHHLQVDGGEAPAPEQPKRGRRQAAASEPPPTREAYAAVLEEQMKDYRMRRAAQLAEDFTQPTGGAVFGGAAREAAAAARGRRHTADIEVPSKQALGSALRQQMADRGGPRAGSAAEHGHQEPAPGAAHGLPPRAPSAGSRPPAFEETRDLVIQEMQRRPEALETTAPLDGAAQAGNREALGASTRLGRSGATVIAGAGANLGAAGGFSSTEARRIRFADECGGAPGDNDRTLAARAVDERADELRRLLDGQGGRPGRPGGSP